jgi:hypothetical protein
LVRSSLCFQNVRCDIWVASLEYVARVISSNILERLINSELSLRVSCASSTAGG